MSMAKMICIQVGEEFRSYEVSLDANGDLKFECYDDNDYDLLLSFSQIEAIYKKLKEEQEAKKKLDRDPEW